SGQREGTKRTLFETLGYGVMDPVAYQTFEASPLPPKIRPTTHMRVAEGVHAYVQEFLGLPDTYDTANLSDEENRIQEMVLRNGKEGTGMVVSRSDYQRGKVPAVGSRMTVIRLGSGEMLIYSPQAPTVELLDQLRDAFPALGTSTKIHLISPSRSPEHWVFLKHWRALFPRSEIWAVSGSHRRLMKTQVDHDLEQGTTPISVQGEVQVAVLEGVPMFREAVLFHKPTGMVMAADAFFSMAMSGVSTK
ncbi:unnamed protein product, partial [Choristocarpus tenellus]